MQKQFEILHATRKNIIKAIEDLTLDKLNTVPSGFKNNVIWNVAHLVATQQLLCYNNSGLKMALDNKFVDRYKKGAQPNNDVTEEEAEYIKTQLLALPSVMEMDYNSSLFKEYTKYPTSYNVTLNSIEDAIQLNNTHEGLHFGYILALKKVL